MSIEELEDRAVPALAGQSLYPADNPWNQKVATAPVAANSTAIINNIVTRYGNGRLHPDFGEYYRTGADLYGIPYNIVHGNSSPKVTVVIDAYDDESDIVPVAIPANAVLEGDYQNGPKVGVNNRGDSHLLIYDVDTNIAYEFFRASRPSENADGRWHADQQTVWDMNTNTFRTLGWTSADAAGLSILAGLVRPDEALPVSQGGQGVINHAIRFTLQNAVVLNQYLYPASHNANPGNNDPSTQAPMGARFRLKASYDISQLNPQTKIIAQAMKDYGMIVADNGSNFFFSGATYSVDASNQFTLTFNDDDIQDSVRGLKSLRFADFEVVDLTPVVTDLSVHTGAAGSSVTVIGQNFSGAAGRLQVFFGNTAATSVTVIDDTHVSAIAPAGSGTVDVRVQSGVTTAANPRNVKNNIFGYGTSATSAGDRFTFSSAPNQAPTVASAAAANPATVVGTTSALSARGADDAGEPGLRYTWSSTGPAAVSFSANNSNAAKNTTATFSQSGTYSFTVTIVDAGGLSVTSNVNVNVTMPPDTARPVGIVRRLPVYDSNPNFVVAWSGTDTGGSGIASYDIFVSIDGGPFAPWRTATTQTQAVYAGAVGRRYGFYAIAVDNAGNRQLAPASAQASTEIRTFNLTPPDNLVAIASAMSHSDESFTYFITQAYSRYLGRGPDPVGLGYWLGELKSGRATDEKLEAQFIGSNEYIAAHGGRGAGWIDGMYRDLLGRPPSAGETAYWVGQLNQGASTTTIAYSFAAGAEREAIRVRQNYTDYLGRSATQADVNHWVDQFVHRGMTSEVMAAQFVGSAEYFNNPQKGAGTFAVWVDQATRAILRRPATANEIVNITPALHVPANLLAHANNITHSDESYTLFVTHAYNTYLGRNPDPIGLGYWLGEMRSGRATDEKIEAQFIGSPEYVASHGGAGSGWITGLYQNLLGRPPMGADVTYWLGRLAAGVSTTSIAYSFAAGAEREAIRVRQNYQTYLGRTPSQPEVDSWVNQFVRGAITSETMAAGFLGSAEYFHNAVKGSGNVLHWLDAAFMDAYHRPITLGEIQALVAAIR